MDKKYLNDGPLQVLPMGLGIALAGPLGLALLRSLELKVTELPMLVAGSICGAIVVVVSWLLKVFAGQSAAKK